MGSLFIAASRFVNPLATRIAASGLISVWGVVHHRGRRSGRAFATPVALAAARDYFYVPLPYGDRTDWCRNLIAAGGGVISYRGKEYVASAPQIVTVDVARPAFPAPLRPVLAFVAKRYLRLERGGLAQHAA